MVPDTVDPLEGDVTETVGAVVSLVERMFETFTVIDAVEELPAASVAVALIVCVPLVSVVVRRLAVNGATLIVDPITLPSTLNVTPVTPTLSEALAEIDRVPDTVAPFVGEEIEIEGGIVSVGTAVVPPPISFFTYASKG